MNHDNMMLHGVYVLYVGGFWCVSGGLCVSEQRFVSGASYISVCLDSVAARKLLALSLCLFFDVRLSGTSRDMCREKEREGERDRQREGEEE